MRKNYRKELKRKIDALKEQDVKLNLQLRSVKNDNDETMNKNAENLDDYRNNLKRLQALEKSIQAEEDGILK